jgi:mRNA interferase MazF
MGSLGLKRGEVWSVAARGAYTGKLRPAVIVQDARFDATASVTICALTTDPIAAPLVRLPVAPDELNGLDRPSHLMVDKLTTVRRTSLRERIGRLGDADIARLDRAIIAFLGVTQGGARRSKKFGTPEHDPRARGNA